MVAAAAVGVAAGDDRGGETWVHRRLMPCVRLANVPPEQVRLTALNDRPNIECCGSFHIRSRIELYGVSYKAV